MHSFGLSVATGLSGLTSVCLRSHEVVEAFPELVSASVGDDEER